MSVLIPTDFRNGWTIFGPLADKNTWKGVLLELPASEKFSGLFCTCSEISVWNLAYTSSGWCHTSSSSFIPIWTLWPTLQPKIGQSHLSAFMALKLFRGLWFGTHTQMVSVLIPNDFCHVWAIFGPLLDKNTRKGELVELPASDTWGLNFIRISASGEFSGLFSKCFALSPWKLVYKLSRLHNILSSYFTRMGSLWPSSCS